MLAVDHGYFMGPTHKLEEPRKTIEPLLAYSDGIMCTRGILRTSIDLDPTCLLSFGFRVEPALSGML